MTAREASVVAVLTIALTSCGGPRSAGPSADADHQTTGPTQTLPASALDETALPAAGRVALRYTLAARSWTASTYRAKYGRRLLLSAGPLRRALEQTRPTRKQIASYRAEDARLDANPLEATRLLGSPTQTRYRIALVERSRAAGEVVRQRATYLVELRRLRGRWFVARFTVEP